MKKLLLLFSLTVALSFSTKAQTSVYHPFPDSDAVWNISWTHYDQGVVTCTETGKWSYIISGDTLINSILYHKIYIPYCTWLSGFCVINLPCGAGYAGAIRQDTTQRKVWLMFPDSSNEGVLYDFNLNASDTVHLPYSNCYQSIYISSIDSVLIGSDYRKRWNINSNPNSDFLIEGIGSSLGLLGNAGTGALCSPFDQGDYTTLSCFQQNHKTLFPDTSTACDIISSVNDLSEKNISITLSPNPFHTTATLEIRNLELGIKNVELKIYDVMGRMVREQQIVNRKSEIVNRDGLGDGLYFYQLRTKDYELIGTGKFVVE
jgi:hypothetical protein